MRYSGSIAKWILLALALMSTLTTLKDKVAAIGTLTAGFWIAFAILHAGDRLGKRLDRAISPRDSNPVDKP